LKYNGLGNTGIQVSEICYGSLPAGPLQANRSIAETADIIRYGLEQGISFIDTAQRYGTYPHIRQALAKWDGKVVIASKSWATGYDEMRQAVMEARQQLDRAVVDIFHLHAARATDQVFVERQGALQYLCEAKAQGLIRAVGISSHSVAAVRAAADQPEIDVIHPLINLLGLGILDGSVADMRQAIEYAASRGKGIYLMKVMAGGHLADRYQEALDYSRGITGVNSRAIGMLSREEVTANIAYWEGKSIPDEVSSKIGKSTKKLRVMALCKACGSCIPHCPGGALSLSEKLAEVDAEKCVMCGYCVPHCPQFALRLY
jgi:aryl-alcohol dehydrogenase-like predicted oxidoreductase/NAD-dependent dihydropyrimidine dehydrogenase PreA subunit